MSLFLACCCCSTQRAHTLRTPKHRSHFLASDAAQHNAHSSGLQARGPLSQWTEAWPTQPAIHARAVQHNAHTLRFLIFSVAVQTQRSTRDFPDQLLLFNATRTSGPPSTGATRVPLPRREKPALEARFSLGCWKKFTGQRRSIFHWPWGRGAAESMGFTVYAHVHVPFKYTFHYCTRSIQVWDASSRSGDRGWLDITNGGPQAAK